ncbi:helix-turn-helix transcriptional regulator [Microbispora sp. ATCC PTA-5024]|uniref:helix-turn-helix transcriptional regulator n=1 Tax=Microbispora sp. ATCC PTA-5024 TaxID=316330 RepID=UPI0012ED7F1C|nr:helix-turn-helix transcriptional regulator [Microbispora sp. ATCC PTA-5024]
MGDAVADRSENRQELARFLRDRRARITPQQAGLPTGVHRRTKGLRREEVAVLAGLSPTWYTYLEQGRDIHPSPQVLDSVARVLGLTEDERVYIHRLAFGRSPAGPADGGRTGEELVAQAVEVAGLSPWPVYAGNQYGDVVAWNAAAAEWYTDFGRLPRDRRNMLWWMLTDPEARERLVDWADETLDVIARLRVAYASRTADRRMSALVRDLEAASADFRSWWNEHHVRGQRLRTRTLVAPGLGKRTFHLAVLSLVDSPTHAVVLHLPVEGATPGPG